MKLIAKPQILASLDTERALRAIEEGFIAYSAGNVQVPPVQAFTFAETNGDCCIKSAYKAGSPTFTVKVSTGFYDNPSNGLPSNDGLMMVFSAHTGQPLALLDLLSVVRPRLLARCIPRRLSHSPSSLVAPGAGACG